MKFSKEKGITLVALVVTIIVLLILAGVSLNLVSGSNGILGRATTAVSESEKAKAKEQAELYTAERLTEYYDKKYAQGLSVPNTFAEFVAGDLAAGVPLGGDYWMKKASSGAGMIDSTYKVASLEGAYATTETTITVNIYKGKTLEEAISGGVIATGTMDINGKIAWSGSTGGSSSTTPEPETPVATTYTITYNANGGTGTMSDSENTVSANTFKPVNGYLKFKEWNTSSDGTGTTVTSGTEVSANTDLYAIWEDMPTITAGQTATGENKCYVSGTKKAIIPAGYTVSSTASTIANGLVISKPDINGVVNEWVWIPVADVTAMYDEDSTGWNLISDDSNTNTKYKSKSLTNVDPPAGINRALTRGLPSATSGYREPGIVVGSEGTSYDAVQANYEAAGFSSIALMAKALVDDYKDMLESVRTYGGFYVGRYELGKDTAHSNKPVVRAGTVMNNTNWYNLYSACKSFSSGDVQSRMIWGNQWDEVCKFINTSGDQVSLTDSTTYGNYSNSTGAAATNSGSGNFNSTTGQLNTNWKANNIYDIAGNCWEWTQEANSTDSRADSGGSFYHHGDNFSVTLRDDNNPASAYGDISSRPTLYVNP